MVTRRAAAGGGTAFYVAWPAVVVDHRRCRCSLGHLARRLLLFACAWLRQPPRPAKPATPLVPLLAPESWERRLLVMPSCLVLRSYRCRRA